jgi:CheY-like chemotaxis protein
LCINEKENPRRRGRSGRQAGISHPSRRQSLRDILRGQWLSSLSQAQTHKPDLIILDLGLPAGDGFVVLDRLRALPHLAVIPVIVVSARDPVANRDRALKAGARAFLQKPVDNDKLLDLIDECLGASDRAAG